MSLSTAQTESQKGCGCRRNFEIKNNSKTRSIVELFGNKIADKKLGHFIFIIINKDPRQKLHLC